jgi:hypothetical protein
MSIQDWGSIGELIGALATLATLVYLAIQIRGNNLIVKTSALQSMLDGGRDRTAKHVAGNPELADIVGRGLSSLDNLDDSEKLRLYFFVVEQTLQAQNVMEFHASKLVSDLDYQAWLDWATCILRTPGGKELWPQISVVITPGISEVLEKELQRTSDLPSLLEIAPIFDRRKETESHAST